MERQRQGFFIALGFSVDEWNTLADALREHECAHDVATSRETGYGPRYAVEGVINTFWCSGLHPFGLAVRQGKRCSALDNSVSSSETMTIREHDCVVLTADLPSERLKAGDVGTVVHVHDAGAAYEVEFMTFAGNTIAVATVDAAALRPVGERDLSHVRELQSA